MSTKEREKVLLDLETLGRFKTARVFKTAVETSGTPPLHITGAAFDDTGELFITAGEDETFRLYDSKTGKHKKTLYSKKYGVTLPRFTHKNSSIIYASTKVDNTIRYHSLHDNKYLQYFKGHEKRVVSLDMSPVSDGFISASDDHTVRLWDLRSPTARGQLNLPRPPLAAYDSSGVIFAVALTSYQRILLYDTKNYDKAPFLTAHINDLQSLELISFPAREPHICSLKFSSNGKLLLVGTAGDVHYILDAFDGALLYRLERGPSGAGLGLERGKRSSPTAPPPPLEMTPSRGISGEELTWTPDSKFVLGGAQDGRVYIWDLNPAAALLDEKEKAAESGQRGMDGRGPETLKPSLVLDGHPGVTRCLVFNPRYAMLATAGAELAFWLPDLSSSNTTDSTSDIPNSS